MTANSLAAGRLSRHLLACAMTGGALLFVMPVILIVLTSLKPESEIVNFYGMLPRDWTLDNYRYLLANVAEAPILRWLFNSALISSSCTLLVLVTCSLAAFALARLRMPGHRALLAIVVATLMVPGQILLIPIYLTLNSLGWLDTPWALIVPAGGHAFGLFLLHQFYLGLPAELEDSAYLDGCSPFGVYRHVILPLSLPALATLAIFTFMGSWNDFLGPMIFMDSINRFTLPVGIALFADAYVREYGITLASGTISVVPLLLVFLLFQRQIIRGISLTGIKG